MAKTGRLTPMPDAMLLDLIVETAPDAIVTIDEAGRILSFSPAAERMFGYLADEVLGADVAVLMPESFRSQHLRCMTRYAETGEKRVIGRGREVQALRKNGEPFIAELAVGELKGPDGPFFTGFMRDVTDRKEIERRSRRLQQSLDQLSRIQTLGELSTAMAHEINQPLTSLSNYARAARRCVTRGDADVAKAIEHLQAVADEAQRAGEILRRMRQFVDRGTLDLKPEDVNDLVREAVRLFEGAALDRPPVTLDLIDDLPRVLVDRVQVQQVLVNLIRNAQEAVGDDADVHVATAMSRAGDAIRLRAATGTGGRVQITVSDDGPGVSDDIAAVMFEPFTSAKPNGLGVGLAVSRAIVEAHGGKIWAETRPGGGTDVHFTLRAVVE